MCEVLQRKYDFHVYKNLSKSVDFSCILTASTFNANEPNMNTSTGLTQRQNSIILTDTRIDSDLQVLMDIRQCLSND